jgi:cell pole-organizing protein PopZ
MALSAAKREEPQSMEDILQSIRQIITDDETEEKKAPPVPLGEGILELTDVVAEHPSSAAPTKANDMDIVDIDKLFAQTPMPLSMPDEEFPPAAAASVAAVAHPAPVPPPPAPPPAVSSVKVTPAPKAQMMEVVVANAPTPANDTESLLSASTARMASDALKTVVQQMPKPEQQPPAPASAPKFDSGKTVEGMVQDMLRPLIKEWLDNNLPNVVQKIVEKEVKRLAAMNLN